MLAGKEEEEEEELWVWSMGHGNVCEELKVATQEGICGWDFLGWFLLNILFLGNVSETHTIGHEFIISSFILLFQKKKKNAIAQQF